MELEEIVKSLRTMLSRGKLTAGEWGAVTAATEFIEREYLSIDRDPYQDIPEGRGVCLTLVRPDLQTQVREEDQMRVDIHTVHKWTGRIRNLEARVTELLASNNRLVDERRAMADERARIQVRRNAALKNGYVAVAAYTNGKVIVVEGDPKEDDQTHNCDALGCGLAHVMYRVEIPEWQRPNECVQMCEEEDCEGTQARTTADGVRLCEACWKT